MISLIRRYSTALRDIDPELLKILCCPQTREPLEFDRERRLLVNRKHHIGYPVDEDGVPNLWLDSAVNLRDTAAQPNDSSKRE